MGILKFVDDWLNVITMYRLVLYFLLLLVGAALILSFFGVFSFGPLALLVSTLFLVGVSWVTNKVFAKVFEAPTNVESVYITALILALIITPAKSIHDLAFLFWVAVLAMSSKYILAVGKKHIFNPAAIAVVITALTLGQSASWWVGTAGMLPFVLLGVLIVRKTLRADMVFYFFVSALSVIFISTFLKGGDVFSIFNKALLHSPILFFAFVMLTEPLTTPPTKYLQIIYGALVGFLFAPQVHLGSFYTTPELALIIGNVFSYAVSPKGKLVLKLKEKNQLSPDVWEFVFGLKEKMQFKAGQYMEWTLGYKNPDSRGNRRYFTIASSPTEDTLRLGVKFYQKSSSYKAALLNLNDEVTVVAGQLAGDFILPKDEAKKLVFIAGGIGITPYRSMIKHLLDTGKKRDIIVLWGNKIAEDIVYRDVFEQACEKLGIKIVHVLADGAADNLVSRKGMIDEQMIRQEVPDFAQRTFYISGSHTMVTIFKDMLKKMNVSNGQIKTDFFPGLV
jgi:ferredoxin-NADP reductase/Na+-translocating ferredoxin:NAD+ oxidoreductase RnfD subunit